MVDTAEATRRLNVKKQTLDDAYAAPANFLEIDILNPITHGVAKKRYTDYEVRMRTNLPVFKVKESSVRRRYSDFEWLRNELERDSKASLKYSKTPVRKSATLKNKSKIAGRKVVHGKKTSL